MKIKNEFIVRKIGTEYFAVSPARIASGAGFIRLNETGLFLWNLFEKDTDVETAAKAVVEQYEGIDYETALADVKEYVEMLQKADALA